MSDLISRQDAINEATKDGAYGYISAEELARLPSAEPEIIRCKDCKWCVEHYDTNGNPYWICKNWDGSTDADGFCHEAERRRK